jgi:hypothetical protein
VNAETVYGSVDIGRLLKVTPERVWYFVRTGDEGIPAHAYITTDGRRYWTAQGMAQWQHWYANRQLKKRGPKGGPNSRSKERQQAAIEAVEQLRKELGP